MGLCLRVTMIGLISLEHVGCYTRDLSTLTRDHFRRDTAVFGVDMG